MNIKLTINGMVIDAQISEADAQKIQPSESRFIRRKERDFFGIQDGENVWTFSGGDLSCPICDNTFSIGNYFTSEKQAQDHIRALKLWQAIKVFRQEREGNEYKKLRWDDTIQNKYFLAFSPECGSVQVDGTSGWRKEGTFFAHIDTAAAAASEFYGELMWYFTEFQDD